MVRRNLKVANIEDVSGEVNLAGRAINKRIIKVLFPDLLIKALKDHLIL
jgi:hypothetical protein